MTPSKPRMIFLNLAVRDLERSKAFFTSLGFGFEPKFTDEKAACMIVNPSSYVMLLEEKFFRSFTKRKPCDTSTHTEGMFALSCASRAEVDELVRKAIASGGTHAMEPINEGSMYGWSFYDPDGHHWEAFWMEEKPEAART